MGKAIRAQVRIILPDIGAFDPMPQTKHPSNAPQLLSSVTVAHLPARHALAHKGDFGHVLVVGGDLGTGGAVLLSAEAALRCGAGLVSVATRPEHVAASLARLPEVMCLGASSANQLMGVLERASAQVGAPLQQRLRTQRCRHPGGRTGRATGAMRARPPGDGWRRAGRRADRRAGGTVGPRPGRLERGLLGNMAARLCGRASGGKR